MKTNQEIVAIIGALDALNDRTLALATAFRTGSVEQKRAVTAFKQLRELQDTLTLLGAGV